MKKQKETPPTLSDLIPDPEARKKIEEALYSDAPLLGPEGVFTQLLQSLVNASLEGELEAHLKSEKLWGKQNRRNGHGSKKVSSLAGELDIKTPRDRSSSFTPELVPKRKKELKGGLEGAILALYA